jgi:hypothetical protein
MYGVPDRERLGVGFFDHAQAWGKYQGTEWGMQAFPVDTHP